MTSSNWKNPDPKFVEMVEEMGKEMIEGSGPLQGVPGGILSGDKPPSLDPVHVFAPNRFERRKAAALQRASFARYKKAVRDRIAFLEDRLVRERKEATKGE